MPRMPADVTTYPSSISADTASHYRGALWADRDGSSRAATEVCPGTWTHLGHRGLCHPISRSHPSAKGYVQGHRPGAVPVCSRVGIPREILTDQGTPFMSRTMADLCRLLQVKQLRTTVYHPQTDGLVERFNKTLKQMLRRVAADDRRDWDQMLPYVLFGIREVPPGLHRVYSFWTSVRATAPRPARCRQRGLGAAASRPSVHDRAREGDEEEDRPCHATHPGTSGRCPRSATSSLRPGGPTTGVSTRGLCLGSRSHSRLQIPGQVAGPLHHHWESGARNLSSTPTRTEKRDSAIPHQPVETLGGDENQVAALATASPVVVDINPHLAAAQKTELQHLVGQFSDVFSPLPGQTRVLQHDVRTPPGTIVRQRPYRIPEARRHAVEEGVQEMLKLGVIEPSRSPWSSPIVMVPKPDGTLRFCNDFRRLNEVSEFDGYPMPRVDELLERLGRARFISTLDLTKGYWQVPLSETAKPKTAFSTPSGHWQYRVLPFGLHGAPADDGHPAEAPSDVCSSLHRWCRHPLGDLGRPPGAAPEGTSRAAAGWAHRQPQEMPPRPAGSKIPRIPGGPGPGPSAGGKGGSDPLGPEAHHQETGAGLFGVGWLL